MVLSKDTAEASNGSIVFSSDEVPDSYSVDEIDLDDIPPIGENEEDNSISPADENDDLDPEEESNNY